MIVTNQAHYGNHARDLARAFRVALLETPKIQPHEAAALTPLPAGLGAEFVGVVVCAPIREETTYAVALHEMGHVCAPLGALQPHARGGSPERALALQLASEEAAWTWAQHYALDWTPAMEAVRTYALSTYLDAHAATLAKLQEQRARLATLWNLTGA